MKLKHPAQHKEAENQRKEEAEKASKRHKTTDNLQQHTISEMAQTWQKYSQTCARRKNIDQALIRMIAINMQPAIIVEDTGFQSLVCLLDSWYLLSSRRHIMRSLLPNMYTTRAGEIKRELLQISHVALTSDLWTSRATESYLVITCHFVTSTWELKFLVLAMFGLKKTTRLSTLRRHSQKLQKNGEFPEKLLRWFLTMLPTLLPPSDTLVGHMSLALHTPWI